MPPAHLFEVSLQDMGICVEARWRQESLRNFLMKPSGRAAFLCHEPRPVGRTGLFACFGRHSLIFCEAHDLHSRCTEADVLPQRAGAASDASARA